MRIILFLITILSVQLAFGQKSTRTFLTSQGKVTTTLKKATNLKPSSPTKTYYYVSAGVFIFTQGSFEGDWLHGLTSFYDQKGVLESKGKFKNGLKHGKWLYWSPSGQLLEIITWKNGLKNGYYRAWNSESSFEEGQWKKNYKNGIWRTIQDGELKEVKHYKMGTLVEPREKKERNQKFRILKLKEKKNESLKKENQRSNDLEVPEEKDEDKE